MRKQFEALRPRRKMLSRQFDGGELDLDEVVRAAADRLACGQGGERLYRDARNEDRDLAVAVLLDASRSTESSVHGQPVIAVAREALVALARGLDACGDQVGLYAFSSLRRDRVFVDVCKTFDEPFDGCVDARIAALKPGFYTRLGAAIRHVSFRLGERANAKKLLLVITDGKPNDLDHYEGRFGVEDTRRAVHEARRQGQAVFAITVDAQARAYLPSLFGRSGFALVPAPERLTKLCRLYTAISSRDVLSTSFTILRCSMTLCCRGCSFFVHQTIGYLMPLFTFEIARRGKPPFVADTLNLSDYKAAWCHVEALAPRARPKRACPFG